MRRETKKLCARIFATLGPASLKEVTVRALETAGVDLFRINISHTAPKDVKPVLSKVMNWTTKPVCIDTQGAQLRTGKFREGSVVLNAGSHVTIAGPNTVGDKGTIPLYPHCPASVLAVGDVLRIDFNSAIVQVTSIGDSEATARVLNGGKIAGNKGIGVDRTIVLPPFTKEDREALEVGRELGIDHVALSFASSATEVKALREMFEYPIAIISKIESTQGLRNLREIAEESDALLIDRGDLSRDIPIQKIGTIQQYILQFGSENNIPVYVATNLLDTMMHGIQPSRAEISDMTSVLLSGAAGLVLAAETAIGGYPVEAVRMASSVIRETESFVAARRAGLVEQYLPTVYEMSLIDPHGGILVQQVVEEREVTGLQRVLVDEMTILDAAQIAHGTYSPLRGFMSKDELECVLDNYRLPDGNPWTLPVLFRLRADEIRFSSGDCVVLICECKPSVQILLRVRTIERLGIDAVTLRLYGSRDKAHPGVTQFMNKGEYCIGGDVFLVRSEGRPNSPYELTPVQARRLLREMGASTVVGFHTRNVVHTAHEWIQKEALGRVNGDLLFVSPVVGPKKTGDFTPEAVLVSYQVMLEKDFYAPRRVVVGAFHTYSRYCGPREAVFTALCRKNYGCSHFIVGRDHTGVGNYYEADASQRIFDDIGDLGIRPLFFDAVYYCSEEGRHTTSCSHADSARREISATQIRRMLSCRERPPEYLLRPEVAEALISMARDGRPLYVA